MHETSAKIKSCNHQMFKWAGTKHEKKERKKTNVFLTTKLEALGKKMNKSNSLKHWCLIVIFKNLLILLFHYILQ